jgi:hypothetical protein
MPLPIEVQGAIESLPRLPRAKVESKLIAKLKIISPGSPWEWYLCGYDGETQTAYGLVNGIELECGPVLVSKFPGQLTPDSALEDIEVQLVHGFQPERVSDIRKRLMQESPNAVHDITRPHRYDAFISYAGTEEEYASSIVTALRTNGLRAWFAPASLQKGGVLKNQIEEGINASYAGIMILSKDYFDREWTQFEADYLLEQYHENSKLILPIWYGVSKQNVASFRPGLVGMFGYSREKDSDIAIIRSLVRKLTGDAPTIATVPPAEDPLIRFAQGLGELAIIQYHAKPFEQPMAFKVWEALLHLDDADYPIFVRGYYWSRKKLAKFVAEILSSDEVIISSEHRAELTKICLAFGYDPSGLIYDE